MSNAIEITSENFDSEVVKSSIPVLIDFWAEWCMPCRMLTPTLDEISKAYEGKLKIGKINVDQQGDLASKFNIISIPTLMVFNKGEGVGQHVGLAPRHALEELFKPYIS